MPLGAKIWGWGGGGAPLNFLGCFPLLIMLPVYVGCVGWLLCFFEFLLFSSVAF